MSSEFNQASNYYLKFFLLLNLTDFFTYTTQSVFGISNRVDNAHVIPSYTSTNFSIQSCK